MLFDVNRKKGSYARLVTIHFPRKAVRTPLYFPSVSSWGTDFTEKLVKFLITTAPHMLISAYDYYHLFERNTTLTQSINSYSDKGNFLFVDSGGYEQKWNDDDKWDFNIYKKTVTKINTDFYTSLDFSSTKVNIEQSFKNIFAAYSILPKAQFLPIFDGNNPAQLVQAVSKFLSKNSSYNLKFIAVREKDCGFTLTERANTILKIRKLIDKLNSDQIIHVLGCGHPLSIAVYSNFGADSFDSRDWYLKTIDTDNLILRDLSHLEIINCTCDSCKLADAKKYPPLVKTLYHNVTNYFNFMNSIQEMIKHDELEKFILDSGITSTMLKHIQS